MSAGQVFAFASQLESVGPCSECGVEHAMPANMVRARREDKRRFYCPNGHVQFFIKSETARLKEELEQQKQATERERLWRESAQKDRDTARRAEAITRGQLKAIKGRVKNGVCPCCKRSFVQLARHMASKHPDFALDAEESA